ncbi:MAG: helicase-associated domain-containing protein, partial [bacterium]
FLKKTGAENSNKMSLTITPAFEAIIPPDNGLLMRFFFEVIGELKKSDTLLIYKITRQSLYCGLDNGIEKHTVIPWLESACGKNIPQNVSFTLSEWLKSYGVLSFEELFILRVDDIRVFEKLKKVLQSKSSLIQRVLPGCGFAIRREDHNIFLDLLLKMGYFPKPFMENPSVISNNEQIKPAENNHEAEEKINKQIQYLIPSSPGKKTPGRKIKHFGKYGEELKALAFTEMIHVIKYAILMDMYLLIEYGESGQNTDRFRIKPFELSQDYREPALHAVKISSGEKRRYNLDNIKRIQLKEN